MMSLHNDEKARRKILDRIIEDNSRWVDEQFGQVDMSDFVDFTKPGPEASFHDDRYSMPDTSGTGLATKALHEFLDNPDEESLAIASEQTGNPDLIDHVNEERAGKAAEQFLDRHPDYWGTEENLELLYAQIARDNRLGDVERSEIHASGAFTLENLERAYQKLLKAGRLELAPGTLRELTPAQRQYCEVLAARNDLVSAVLHYCAYRMGEKSAEDLSAAHNYDPWEVLKLPEWRPLAVEASMWAFQQITPDFIPTPERLAYFEKYTAGRWVTTAMLKQLWEKYKSEESEQAKHDLIFGRDNTPETPENINFEDMSDAQIESLKTRTLRHAQDLRRRRR